MIFLLKGSKSQEMDVRIRRGGTERCQGTSGDCPLGSRGAEHMLSLLFSVVGTSPLHHAVSPLCTVLLGY